MNVLTFSVGLAAGLLLGALVIAALLVGIARVIARKQEALIGCLEDDLEKSQAENVILRMKVNDLERHQGVPFHP